MKGWKIIRVHQMGKTMLKFFIWRVIQNDWDKEERIRDYQISSFKDMLFFFKKKIEYSCSYQLKLLYYIISLSSSSYYYLFFFFFLILIIVYHSSTLQWHKKKKEWKRKEGSLNCFICYVDAFGMLFFFLRITSEMKSFPFPFNIKLTFL